MTDLKVVSLPPKDAPEQFSVSDVVVLRCGGALMVVTTSDPHWTQTTWLNRMDDQQQGKFLTGSLLLCVPEPEPEPEKPARTRLRTLRVRR